MQTTSWTWISLTVMVVLGTIGATLGLLLLAHELQERYFESARRWREKGLCGDCGYSLAGLSNDVDRCPECGAKLAGLQTDVRDA
jgi:rubrerythrin